MAQRHLGALSSPLSSSAMRSASKSRSSASAWDTGCRFKNYLVVGFGERIGDGSWKENSGSGFWFVTQAGIYKTRLALGVQDRRLHLGHD
jgi:hypothetical protein